MSQRENETNGNGSDSKRVMANKIKDTHARLAATALQLVKQAQEFKSLAVDSNALIGDDGWERWLETDCGISADSLSTYLALGRVGPQLMYFFSHLANSWQSKDGTTGSTPE